MQELHVRRAAYASIEPEMSHSTTTRRARGCRRRRTCSTGSPPLRRARANVARRSSCSPLGWWRGRRPGRIGGVSRRRRIMTASSASSRSSSAAKSVVASRSSLLATASSASASGPSSEESPSPEPSRASPRRGSEPAAPSRSRPAGGAAPESATADVRGRRRVGVAPGVGRVDGPAEHLAEDAVEGVELFLAGHERDPGDPVEVVDRRRPRQPDGLGEPPGPLGGRRQPGPVQQVTERHRDRGEIAHRLSLIGPSLAAPAGDAGTRAGGGPPPWPPH